MLTNVVRGLDLVLGESWPGNYEPEDHDYHERNSKNSPIEIEVGLDGVVHSGPRGDRRVESLTWRYPDEDGRSLRMTYESGDESPFVSNEVRGQCFSIVVGADRRLSYQLSYTSKFTFLAKLMKQFHRALTADDQRVERLRTKFTEVKSIFDEVPEFSTFAKELDELVRDLSTNLEYGLTVDFSAYDPSNFFQALRVHPSQDGQVRAFDELGTGQEQILALSFAYAYAKAFHGEAGNLVLVIEEPEAHLHPLALQWVGKRVHELAQEGVQIVVTTHSPAFLNVMNLHGVVALSKPDGATRVKQLSGVDLAAYCRSNGAPKATEEAILPFYAAAATDDILAGLFSRKVLLVEGPTEALALPIYLRKVGFDPVREGIAVIPVHGVGNLAKWWRLFTAYEIPTYVIFDNDGGDDAAGTKSRDLLRTLSVEDGRHQHLLRTSEWVVEPGFSVFGKNFEEVMRSEFGARYAELEQEAQEQHGLSAGASKPLVARYVAERLETDRQAAAWQKFQELRRAVEALRCP